MKNILMTLAVTLLFSCSKNKIAKDPEPAPTEITSDTTVLVDGHNSRNSIDYLGMYRGSLPCADCDSVHVAIELGEDFHYLMVRTYFGSKNKREEVKGSYSWNEAGNAILLDNLAGEPNQFLVVENGLVQLDLDGNRIQGKLSDRYIFKKLSETEAAKTDSRVGQRKTSLSGRKWLLSEMDGKIKLRNTETYISFEDNERFTAFAGCNRMGGSYKASGSKIALTDIFATKMACENMQMETRLTNILQTANNFVINREVLLLRDNDVVLAKFDAEQK